MPLPPPPPPRAVIRDVTAGSAAHHAGVKPGDRLVSVNECEIPDVLAYRRELMLGEVTVTTERSDGSLLTFEVAWEDPGLEFEDVIFDGIRTCANKCDFCYVHQMPKGFRKSLYMMDDDFRTSFLYGSFVTLTNLTDADVNRILDEHLSPLYVSVHTANEDLRSDMMKWWRLKVKDPAATRIRDMIERLEPIDLYTQMVLLPGRNDGDEMEETLAYLAERPNVQAVAVVPVGLTDHRTNLPDLRTYTAEESREVIRRVEAVQRRMLSERGTRFVFLSDEFYINAGLALPPTEAYEGFAMLENGVGMTRDFLDGGMPTLPPRIEQPRRVLIATGTLFGPILERALAPLASVEDLQLEVRALENRTFGHVTSVAGLLAGRDVLLGVKPGEADVLMLSPNVVKYGTELMLDDRSLDDLRRELGMDVVLGGTTLHELTETILFGAEATSTPQFGFSTHAIKEASQQH